MKKINISKVNETVYHEVLDNGLNIYLVPNYNVKNYYITFSTKFGSLDTEFKVEGDSEFTKVPNGVAHFLEHLTFKMEDGKDASDLASSLGCKTNAYTSQTETCYEIYGYKDFKTCLEFLLDFVQTPCYKEEEVEAEKGIICEEIKMRSDHPSIKLHEAMNKALFKYNKRKYSVAGTCEEVNATTLEDILACYNTFYHPSNMYVIITGNFNPEEASAVIYENQKKKDFGEPIKIKRKHISEPDAVVSTEVIEKANVEIPKAGVCIKIPKNVFKDLNLKEYELSIYIAIIINSNFGRSSELKARLTSGNIITGGVMVYRYFTDEHLIINLFAETEYPNKFISMIKEQLENLSITDKELTRKKRVAQSGYILTFDSIEAVNSNILNDLILYDEVIDNYYDTYTELDITTAQKIVDKLSTDNITTIILESEDK